MAMRIRGIIIMTDTTALVRLMSWLSPVFPTGGFAYSSGLEMAVQMGLVTKDVHLQEWLMSALKHGALRNDAILLAAARHCGSNANELHHISDLGLALAGSAERYLEMTAQGSAFVKAVKSWDELSSLELPSPCPLCVAVGAAARIGSIEIEDALAAFLHSAITNQLQASIRLSVTGQVGAARILAALEPEIVTLAEFASSSTLDDLGSAAINAEIMSMRHEQLHGRMFRS